MPSRRDYTGRPEEINGILSVDDLDLIEGDFPFDTALDYTKSDLDAAVEAAKHEGLHQAICALYAAQHKNMTIGYLLQALRDHDARTTDDMLVAVARFNASFWGCNG